MRTRSRLLTRAKGCQITPFPPERARRPPIIGIEHGNRCFPFTPFYPTSHSLLSLPLSTPAWISPRAFDIFTVPTNHAIRDRINDGINCLYSFSSPVNWNTHLCHFSCQDFSYLPNFIFLNFQKNSEKSLLRFAMFIFARLFSYIKFRKDIFVNVKRILWRRRK